MRVLICSTILVLRLINKGGSSPSQSVLITPSLSHRQDIKALVGWKIQASVGVQGPEASHHTDTCSKKTNKHMQYARNTQHATSTDMLWATDRNAIFHKDRMHKVVTTADIHILQQESFCNSLLKCNAREVARDLCFFFLWLWRETICHLFQSTIHYK